MIRFIITICIRIEQKSNAKTETERISIEENRSVALALINHISVSFNHSSCIVYGEVTAVIVRHIFRVEFLFKFCREFESRMQSR